MARQINAQGTPQQDTYLQRLYKLIPSEITTAYVAIAAALYDANHSPEEQLNHYDHYLFYAFLVLLLLVPIYLKCVQNITNWAQIAATTISFPIWAATVSAAAVTAHFGVPAPVLSVVLTLWTTILPVLVR